MFNIDISEEFEFSERTPELLDEQKFGKEKWPGKEWPVVYLIYNETEIYIGETVDAKNRMMQHYANEERRKLKHVILISDGSFNKSVIQDLEAYLIAHVAADSKRSFKLQNSNSGFQKHEYYRSKKYEELFNNVWEELKKRKLARQTVEEIENSNIFKYSPYKTLTSDQYLIASDIINELAGSLSSREDKTFLVNGGAGTGKTILGIYITKLLTSKATETAKLDDVEMADNLDFIHNKKKDFKIGIVIPMSNLRTIVKDTFRHTYGLSPELVLSPVDVANSSEKFDLLIVDEAHRLRRRKNLTMYNSFDRANEKLGLDENGAELDWILKKSKSQILFYDSAQSIKPTDIPKEKIEELKYSRDCHVSTLRAQIRCNRGGEKYIDYVGQIFSHKIRRRSDWSSQNTTSACLTMSKKWSKRSVEKMISSVFAARSPAMRGIGKQKGRSSPFRKKIPL